MAPKKEVDPLRGQADLERKLEAGIDPNADLKSAEPETKAQAAFLYILSGASYTDAARMCGYSSAYHCRTAVERVLANAADSPEDKERMRVLQDRRYNRLLQSVMGKAVDPSDANHLAYNARALAIVDRISVLHGVNAPAQVQFSPTDQYIQDYMVKMGALAAADRADAEADILDEDQMMERTTDGES